MYFPNKNKFILIGGISLFGTLIIFSFLYLFNIYLGVENFSNNVSLPAYTIIPGILVILSIWAIVKSEPIKELPRKSLFFLSLAFIFWFLGEQTWHVYEHVLDIDPYPSVADFFYLMAPIFMFLSLKNFLNTTEKKISKKIVIFGLVISLIILIPSVIATFEVSAEDKIFEVIIALAYPISDIFLLVPAIIVFIFILSNNRSFFWLMIIVGLIIMVSADTIFLYLVIADEYVDGHPVDILFISSYTIWAFMMFYTIIGNNQNVKKKELMEIYKKYGSTKFEKYGISIGLVLINVTVVLLLVGINIFVTPKPENTILSFFSWILIMTVIIFSSIIIILNSKLKKVLQNRTVQLEEKTGELIKSERFSAIGELASRIAHDIRNPLSNISMSIELMKISHPETKLVDKEVSSKLDLISKNVQRISHQVNDVLEFVQNRKMNIESVRLIDCFHETIESIHLPSNISIKLPKSQAMAQADPFQLQIVFNNIILNAIQAIGHQEGVILIRFQEGGDNTLIEIENSGPNIGEEILPHIFDSLVTTKQVGTGLGLASCKTIVENHGGSITVKTDPTIFSIDLPNTHDKKY